MLKNKSRLRAVFIGKPIQTKPHSDTMAFLGAVFMVVCIGKGFPRARESFLTCGFEDPPRQLKPNPHALVV